MFMPTPVNRRGNQPVSANIELLQHNMVYSFIRQHELDNLLLTHIFYHLTARYRQFLFDSVLLTHFFRHLAADYRTLANKSFNTISDWILFR